jgi:transposase
MPPPPPTSPISPEQIAALPPEVRAVVEALVAYYEARLAALQAEVADLKSQVADRDARLAAVKNPQNSSLPPSTQHPHAKPAPQKPKSKRKRGGQPGHRKFERALIPAEECAAIFDHRPTSCRKCGRKLQGDDPRPLRHQVWEMPDIRLPVTEHRRHRLPCDCGEITCGELPAGVPHGQAGPRLVAFVAMLMGDFRLSKRKVAAFLTNILHTPCSPGWVVKLQKQATAALRPTYDGYVAQLSAQGRLNIDESPSKQGSLKTWLWTFVAATFTVFALRPTRKAVELYSCIGEEYAGVVGCDRAKMYMNCNHIQWCWAHLLRDFQALVDSGDGQAKRLGRELLREAGRMFDLWGRVRDGTLTRRGFQQKMKSIRQATENLLLRGCFSGNPRLVGMCNQLHDGRANLWTFVNVPDVEPTNNSAERALRPAVIWRKLSFGTQSECGDRFVETMLTVLESCRQQDRNAFAYVTAAVESHFAAA